ncbi:hypothetical protein PMAYCL1PPCAC_11512 [Pristionchus mayeri]|uniref:G protein-coupled receptor n=1 Tax=Pristionchus mayeri TaxID=1317129 RepID=A0AAN4ZHE6_9BILA|nr:hypothetical protein PMAYCL1PPCAC_11512 [Pristionchus mayeri]
MGVNDSLKYGFQYEQEFHTRELMMSFQLSFPLFNTFIAHPLMLLVLCSNRSMNRGVFRAYALTEFGIFLIDVSTLLLRVSFIPPFVGIYCEGFICRAGAPNAVILAVLSTGILFNIPCYMFLLVRMHQLITAGTNQRWKLSERLGKRPVFE